jgi:hypothetical protein
MKKKRILGIVFGAALFAGSEAFGAEGILYEAQLSGTNYCHLRFPAIREETLTWSRPVLRSADSGDVIDFYGPCDYDPVGKDAAGAQLRHHREGKEWAD